MKQNAQEFASTIRKVIFNFWKKILRPRNDTIQKENTNTIQRKEITLFLTERAIQEKTLCTVYNHD